MAVNSQLPSKFEPYSPEYFRFVEISLLRTEFIRKMIELCVKDASFNSCGFSELDVILILGMIEISRAYQPYFVKWMKAVRGNPVAKFLEKLNEEGTTDKVPKEFFNHYTVIHKKGEDKLEKFSKKDVKSIEELTHTPFSLFFNEELTSVCEKLKELVQNLDRIQKIEKDGTIAHEIEVLINYFNHMIQCYYETDIQKLQDTWKTLDRIWMDSKYWIQFVHDIEYGYVDPLRTKIIPDFVFRFLDKIYDNENETIEQVYKKIIVEYFENDPKRKGKPLAVKNLENLKKTKCYITVPPFFTGNCLCFRFGGQSIPNYADIRAEKGSKIYLDAGLDLTCIFLLFAILLNLAQKKLETTLFEFEELKEICAKVFETKEELDLMASYLSAADYTFVKIGCHELGHCIYALSDLGDALPVELQTTLEEPRADFTALFVLGELRKLFPVERIRKIFICIIMQFLRFFNTYHVEMFKPYLSFVINFFNSMEKFGFVRVKDNSLKFDVENDDAINNVLEDLRKTFEMILDGEDKGDCAELVKIEQQLKVEGDVCKWLVKKLA